MNDIKTINKKIAKLARAERVTKVVLGELSREVLEYIFIQGTEDISPVNRLLAVLTPMNKRTAILFFKNFVSWKFDDDACVFTKKNKKRYDESKLNVELFLANADSDIWTWAAEFVKVEPKEVDWTQRLTQDINKAMDAGLSFNDIMAILNNAVQEDLKEVA
jgi:hypothetical protein